MDKRNLDRFVNSFLLILLAATQVVRCSPEEPKIASLNLNATSTAAPKAFSTVQPVAASSKSPDKTSDPTLDLSRLQILSVNLTSALRSNSTPDQASNQANASEPNGQHPINRFASDRQSISDNNKFYDHSNHLTNLANSSFASLQRLTKLNNRALPGNTTNSHRAPEQGEPTNRWIRLPSSSSAALNSSMNATERKEDKREKSDDAKLSHTPGAGNQSQISREAVANSTVASTEQMSFIFSIDKLINLTNDHPPDSNDLYRKQTIITIHRNASSSSAVDSSNSSKTLATDKEPAKVKKSSAMPDTKEPPSVDGTNLTQEVRNITVQADATTKSFASSVTVLNALNESSTTPASIRKITENIQALPANQSLPSNRTTPERVGSHNQTESPGFPEPKHSEKVLVYPVLQANQSNDQSLSAQSKRAPHYLEEKFRKHPDRTSTTSTTSSPPERPDRPTPILDTRPLVEDVGIELNLRALDERLISEEELLHHSGSSVEADGSYEYAGHHGSHHSDGHHANKHNQSKQTLDPSWFEQNCLENCTCESSGRRWPEVRNGELSGQSRKTLNCSNNELDDYPVLANELSKHVERLSLADNNIRTLQVNADLFYCERLIELDLSNNQLQQWSANPFSYKHIQHPVVEFHPSHNHHLHKEVAGQLPKTTTSLTISAPTSPANFTGQLPAVPENATTPTVSLQPKNSTTANRQSLFSHCHRLRVLLLSGNDLNTLSTGCFRGLKRLRELHLDNAQIRFIEKNAFLGANELRLLSLRFNQLTAVHADMFQHMINLKVLDLTGNSLTYLGAGVFNSLVALQALHLGHNKLRQLSFQCFSGLDGLQLLTMNSNQLESVPRFALQPLKKLKILDMSTNPISKILEDDFSHSFVQLLLLNHLDRLQHVARFSFWDLPYLNELQISHCEQFVHLDEQAIVGAPSLHRLKLDHNAFSQLDDRLLENLARMTIAARRQLKVYLAANPFKCDCFLKPVYLCARDQAQCKIELPDRSNITCTFKRSDNLTDGVTPGGAKELYEIDELTDNQLPNECAPTFVPIITPVNVTIVKRLRSKFTLSCKAIGSPTPSVYWLQPSGEIHKEKLITRHGHDLMESDLLSLPHSFQNDDTGLLGSEPAVEQSESQLTNQATAAFLPLSKAGSVLMSSGGLLLPSTAHHGSSTLRIGHLTPNDAGLYTCIAENRVSQIRSHVQLITQQLKIDLEAENTSTNYITIRWQVNSIFNPPLSEILGNDVNSSTTSGSNVTAESALTANASSPLFDLKSSSKYSNLPLEFKSDFEEAIANAKNQKSLNLLDYQLLYKMDSFGTDEERQSSAETLGSERIFESNKFFASYESVQINRQLRSFTVAGLRPGSRYKICIAVREPRLSELDSVHQAGLFRKRAIRRFRLKRNLISVESASYLAIGCLHAETAHAAFYARNILRVEKFQLPILISNALSTAMKVSLICSLVVIVLALFVTGYTWTKQRQRRSAYETPRKTLLSIARYSQQHSDTSASTPYLTPYSTPSHAARNPTPLLQMENIYSPLMLTARRH